MKGATFLGLDAAWGRVVRIQKGVVDNCPSEHKMAELMGEASWVWKTPKRVKGVE